MFFIFLPDLVFAMRTVVFAYNGKGGTLADGELHVGVVAQELRDSCPECKVCSKVLTAVENLESTRRVLGGYSAGTQRVLTGA